MARPRQALLTLAGTAGRLARAAIAVVVLACGLGVSLARVRAGRGGSDYGSEDNGRILVTIIQPPVQ